MIESTSQSRLVLSKLGKELQHIVILSESALPSWFFMLRPFLETLNHIIVHISLPSKSEVNLMGISRRPNIHVHVKKSSSSSDGWSDMLSSIIEQRSTVFINGSLSFLDLLLPMLVSLKSSQVCVLLSGKIRFSKLIRFKILHWRKVKHHIVGGVTFSSFWVGSLTPFTTMPVSPSLYVPICLGDLLEFAPKSLKVEAFDIKDLKFGRVATVVNPDDKKSTFWKFGLIPLEKIFDPSTKVICDSPFTATGFGSRSFTLVEKIRFLDFPVNVEKVIAKSKFFNDDLLATCIPIKVVHHSMLLLGYFEVGKSTLPLRFSSNTSQDIINGNGVLVGADNFNVRYDSDPFIDSVAVKNDDAAIPVQLWNQYILKDHKKLSIIASSSPAKWMKALAIMRKYCTSVWHKRIAISFRHYLKREWPIESTKYLVNNISLQSCNVEFQRDVLAGLDCIEYATKADWWEWLGGSRLFFWRWTPEFREMARDGIPMFWLLDKRPTARKPQPEIIDPITYTGMKKKVSKVRRLGYVRRNFCKSLIRYFSVPKGDTDIRMVYDGTASGFNDLIWVPNFGLPTVEVLLRNTRPGTWMVDLDVGDQFLNFMLHDEAQKYVGIDITPLFKEELKENKKILWESWCRCAMGLKSSPYQAVRAMLFADEFLKGSPSSSLNPLRFHGATVNLPGSINYDPSQPWFTISRKDGSPATVLATYVDDERIHGDSYDNVWMAAHQVASRECYLGIQDAARKRRPPSQMAGAWAGTIVRTNSTEVGKTISHDRWTKARNIISSLFDQVSSSKENSLNTKELLSHRGFLIYIVRTFTPMNPYLKGLHLTIDSWRPNRDEHGWRDPNFQSKNFSSESEFLNLNNAHDYPTTVDPVPRLLGDLQALMRLTADERPPVIITQSKRIYVVKYGFGDASGGGFGSSLLDPDSGIDIIFGTWNESGRSQSSNFREFGNLVIRLESEAENGKLSGAELFLFTDNSTTESAYHNGTSSSPLLFDLVLRLRILELKFGVRLHVIHVPGTRMIAQGTDGISRGNQMEGVMSGSDMLNFIPLNLGAIQRNPNLIFWFRFWLDCPNLTPLSISDWLKKGQGLSNETLLNTDNMPIPKPSNQGVLLWAPPPAIADIAIEFIRTSIHRRPSNIHVFVCPKIMTYKWRRPLFRSCDFYFYLDVEKDSVWDEDQFESILIGVYLPLLPFAPWTFRRSKLVLELERALSKVQASKARSKGFILRKFLLQTREIPSMSESVVRRML